MLRNRADGEADHRRFVERAVAAESVWALKGEQGYAWCESNEDAEQHVVLFWSDRAYAARAGKAEFPEYDVCTIPLFDFLFRWLPGMSDDEVLAGTNWTGELAGLEVEPMTLHDEVLAMMTAGKRAEYTARLKCGIEEQKGNERA
jgi:hypothetical protein